MVADLEQAGGAPSWVLRKVVNPNTPSKREVKKNTHQYGPQVLTKASLTKCDLIRTELKSRSKSPTQHVRTE